MARMLGKSKTCGCSMWTADRHQQKVRDLASGKLTKSDGKWVIYCWFTVFKDVDFP